jgi:hypothetical protein
VACQLDSPLALLRLVVTLARRSRRDQIIAVLSAAATCAAKKVKVEASLQIDFQRACVFLTRASRVATVRGEIAVATNAAAVREIGMPALDSARPLARVASRRCHSDSAETALLPLVFVRTLAATNASRSERRYLTHRPIFMKRGPTPRHRQRSRVAG